MVFKNPFTISLKKTKIQKAIYNIVSDLNIKREKKNLHVHCDLNYFKEFCF